MPYEEIQNTQQQRDTGGGLISDTQPFSQINPIWPSADRDTSQQKLPPKPHVSMLPCSPNSNTFHM